MGRVGRKRVLVKNYVVRCFPIPVDLDSELDAGSLKWDCSRVDIVKRALKEFFRRNPVGETREGMKNPEKSGKS